MLDLYTLRKKFSAVSALPLITWLEAAGTPGSICIHYTEKLNLDEGQAGHVVTDEFLFFGKIIQRQTGAALLLGPATEYPLTADAKKRITTELGLRGKEAAALQKKLSAIPVMKLTDFMQQLSFLNYIINEDDTVQSTVSSKAVSPPAAQKNSTGTSSHNTAEFEDYVLSCVEAGRPDLLEKMFASSVMNQYTTGIISSDSMRAQKNILITSTTLACRAAVRGGLDYDTALSMSDDFIHKIESIYTYTEFMQLLEQMLLSFATRTQNQHLPADASALIRSAARKISGQLYQKISVEQLAEDLHVSRSYLSHQFKRETGKSLTDYITEQKIGEAIRLMNTTDMTLAEISYQLAFSSQSYFHNTFKKTTGVNPGKYPRKKT